MGPFPIVSAHAKDINLLKPYTQKDHTTKILLKIGVSIITSLAIRALVIMIGSIISGAKFADRHGNLTNEGLYAIMTAVSTISAILLIDVVTSEQQAISWKKFNTYQN